MVALLLNRSSRRAAPARWPFRALVPCLFALGCSLEVAGNGAQRSPLESGTDSVGAGGGPDAPPDAGPSAPILDAAPPEIDAGPPAEPRPDASHALDAHVEVEAAAEVDSGAPAERDAAPSSSCAVEGRYGLRFSFDVSWVGTQFLGIVPVIEAGAGELSFIVLMEAAPAAGGLATTFRTCSSDVPSFVAELSREQFQARIDDEVWDSDEMPLFSSTLDVACLEPGCAVRGRPLYALIGAELPAIGAPWPGQPSQGEWPDHDGDGADGVATRMLGPEDGDYAYPPLDLLSVRRLRELALGLRVVVGFDGVLDGCDAITGQTTQSSIETRAVACTAMNAPLSCTPADLEFLNNNLPVWTAHEGRFEARRLPPSGDCEAARKLFRRGRP